jgi:hypothetical protein
MKSMGIKILLSAALASFCELRWLRSFHNSYLLPFCCRDEIQRRQSAVGSEPQSDPHRAGSAEQWLKASTLYDF